MITRYKHGDIKFLRERGDEFARLAEAGVSPKEIAARFNVNLPSVWSLLRYRGIDREMLRLYREAA